MLYNAILLTLISQYSAPPSVQTLGSVSERMRDIEIISNRQDHLKLRSSSVLSSQENAPSTLSESSVEDSEVVTARFSENVRSSREGLVESYLDVQRYNFLPGDCNVVGKHPSGVPRVLDGKLNGISILALCGERSIIVQIMDYSQELEQEIKTTLPDKHYPISGGFMSSSIGKTVSDRTRRQSSAVGGNSSVMILIQSKQKSEDNFFIETVQIAQSVLSELSARGSIKLV